MKMNGSVIDKGLFLLLKLPQKSLDTFGKLQRKVIRRANNVSETFESL